MSEKSAEVEAIKSKMLKKSYYLMFRNVVDGSRVPDLMLDHYQWLINLEKQGKVFASGPMFDKEGESLLESLFLARKHGRRQKL